LRGWKKDMKRKKKDTRPDSKRSLSTRECEVLMWLRCGKTSWALSVILRISERTVNFYVNNIMRKLGVINRMQAVSVAFDSELGNVE
jgi:DNA-binding NarL/FixJ family response regulator